MKNFIKISIAFSVIVFAILTGCTNPVDGIPPVVESAKVSVIIFDDGTLPSPSVQSSRAVSFNDLEVSFRSSGVDFYQIGDFTNISEPISTSVSFANEEETLVFVPGNVSVATRDSNPVFTEGTYDMIRLDAGRGEFTFNYQGSEVFVGNSENLDRNSWTNLYGMENGGPVVDHQGNQISGEFGDAITKSGFNGNSIVLVDSSKLSEAVLVPRNELRDMTNDHYYWYDYQGDVWDWDPTNLQLPDNANTVINDVNSTYFNSLPPVVQNILLESRVEFDSELALFDIDGALFIPFDPQTIPSDASRVTVEIEWSVDDSIVETANGYEMANRVEGTSFDFSVNLVVE